MYFDSVLQYLAFQDLCEAASQSKQRRLEMFSLSQPGGHPHHWVAVSSASLGLLRDITARMAEFNNSMLTTGPTRQLSGDKKMPVVSTPTPRGYSFWSTESLENKDIKKAFYYAPRYFNPKRVGKTTYTTAKTVPLCCR